MNATSLAIVRRNVTIFLRDRGQVFFSLLAPLILLLLYVLFLGKMQVDSMSSDFPADKSEINAFVYSWVLAGMVLITTLTTSLSALSSFVDDRVSGRFKEFRVSPVRSTELVVGYLVSGVVISLLLSTFVLVVGSVVMGLLFGAWATPLGYAQAFGYTVLMCLTFSSLAAFVVTFVRSSGAYSGLATLVGTLSGFLAFAYIPIGVVSKTVGSVLNTLPFAQGAMLFRDPLAGPALDAMVEGIPEGATRDETVDFLRTFYGFDAHIGSFQLTPPLVIGILLVLAVVFAALGVWRIRTLTRSDMR